MLKKHGMTAENVAKHLYEDEKLHAVWEDFWWSLPDNPSIRVQPFFEICDLCEEELAMERRYRLVSLRYRNCECCGSGTLPPETTVIGEYETREEMNEVYEKLRYRGNALLVDFLVDGRWYRGNINSVDPIAWTNT